MRDFRQTRVDAVVAVEQMGKKLMYGIEPNIDLDQIIDNLANSDIGYSFIIDKYNKLQKAFHVLIAAATSVEEPRSLVNQNFQY